MSRAEDRQRQAMARRREEDARAMAIATITDEIERIAEAAARDNLTADEEAEIKSQYERAYAKLLRLTKLAAKGGDP